MHAREYILLIVLSRSVYTCDIRRSLTNRCARQFSFYSHAFYCTNELKESMKCCLNFLLVLHFKPLDTNEFAIMRQVASDKKDTKKMGKQS